MNTTSISNSSIPFISSFPKSSFTTPNTCSLPLRNPRQFSSPSLVIETDQGHVSQDKTSNSVARRLILLRHAKSSWDDSSLRDHDRPLSESGRADAVNVSRKLQQLGWIPQLILLSDAQRTRETLKIMQKEVPSFLEAEVRFVPSFYSIAAMDGQTAEHLQHAICQFARDETLAVMCMGHNRGWEEAASMFSGASVELKTCNAALLEATGKSWEEAMPSKDGLIRKRPILKDECKEIAVDAWVMISLYSRDYLDNWKDC
ncbi:Histidine phosphatase superfamily, clade-1 [Dillenia turbinata]|uniref:Histidine phosphatase superfamily, clade-1 n=1 Tax=Dillenia turbinata TaxID=194707 RepID=A0AAN8VUU8_9MAGN